MKLIIGFILICIICLCAARNFTHDSKNGVFLKDGKPFRYISGDLEYFKVPSVHWKDRLNKYKLAGLNAIQTYIEWRSHEPEKGQYDFSGDNDVVNFLKLANETGLLVVLRPGPFVNAERDNGGLPYWLQGNNPNMVIRSADESYLKEVDQWFSVLFPKLVPLLYKNGGPIITVQVENEFGFYGVLSNDLKLCDTKYKNHLKDLFIKYLGNDVVLFTVDGLTPEFQKCGSVEGVFATTDFGIGTDPKAAFANQKLHNGFGPYVNSEYYTGWIEIWEWAHPLRSTKIVVDHFDTMLSMNASVNIYPFHGGTSFGFNPGANIGEENTFQPETTHYDFDAPLNEAGDPTEKFAAFREVIGKYEPLPKIALPTASPKMELPAITLTPIASIFDNLLLSEPTASKSPLTFEQLKLGHGFVRYSTTINFDPTNPSVLSLNETGLRDRALIFVNEEYVGTLSRTHKVFDLPIVARKGDRLDIVVENQGRRSFNPTKEFKGLLENVKLGSLIVENWNHYRLYSNWTKTLSLIQNHLRSIQTSNVEVVHPIRRQPHFYAAEFQLPNDAKLPLDSFLRLEGWSKGVAFINGFNLGRYWNNGPQLTLYTPHSLFKPYPQQNLLVVFELEESPITDLRSSHKSPNVQFIGRQIINGTTPTNTFVKMDKIINY